LSQNRVALAIRVPARRINEIIQASVVSPQTLLFA
jgi:plasmid maintenance system antidote protein VapI